jgi:hypothetical protein
METIIITSAVCFELKLRIKNNSLDQQQVSACWSILEVCRYCIVYCYHVVTSCSIGVSSSIICLVVWMMKMHMGANEQVCTYLAIWIISRAILYMCVRFFPSLFFLFSFNF